jgi:large subunit ribosomal protein L10
MALTREQKQKIIEDLKEKIARHKAILFLDYSNLKAKDLFSLRNLLKKEKSLLKVAKKTLLGLALKQEYPELAEKIKELEGQPCVVFSFTDEITPAKIVYQFSKENSEVKILGAFFEGEFQTPEAVIALAQLPTREELLGKLVGSLSNPMAGFVNSLRANLERFVYVLSQAPSRNS